MTNGPPYPKGPCRYMVDTWAVKGLLYHDFGAYVCTTVVLGPFGIGIIGLPWLALARL